VTLDGFFGTLHTNLHNIGIVKQASDDAWKEVVARYNTSYRVLRDIAYALKHGTLTRKKSRLVTRSNQILTLPGAFQLGAFQRNAFRTDRVWIEGTDTDYIADEVIRDVVQIAESWLTKTSKDPYPNG
jgi:hypothetical protein